MLLEVGIITFSVIIPVPAATKALLSLLKIVLWLSIIQALLLRLVIGWCCDTAMSN